MSENAKGAGFMVLAMLAFALNDTCVKAVGAIPLFQLLVLRGVLATVLVAGLAVSRRALRFDIAARDWGLIALRTSAEVGAAYFFITALREMPLANVTALLQTLPMTVTLGGALLFKEPIGPRRIAAIALGFIGVLLIVRPGTEGFNSYTIYALIAVLFVTVRDLATRRLAPGVPSLTVTFCAALGVTLFSALATLGETWVPLSTAQGTLIVGSSVFIFAGYFLSVAVMRLGALAVVTPFRYAALLWALLLGWLVFGDWPAPLTLLGAAIIVATGLFTLYRDSRVAAALRAQTRLTGREG